jgi:hypothetical protein
MINPPDLNQSSKPLVDFVAKTVQCQPEHAEFLVARILEALPELFRLKPEVLTQAIALAGIRSINKPDNKVNS